MKTCLQGLQTIKAQTSLHVFVTRFLESIIFKVATSLSIVEKSGLSLALSETRKTDFVALRPNIITRD